MTCSELLVRIIDAGPRGLARVHIADIPTLEHLQSLHLVTDNMSPYWLESRVYARCERMGHYDLGRIGDFNRVLRLPS